MTRRYSFTGLTAAISISDSPDLRILGLGPLHLEDAMLEIARHLLAQGARLIYGGDLRAHGFTEQLCELVLRHYLNSTAQEPMGRVANYLAWPVHASAQQPWWGKKWPRHLPSIDLVCLTREGRRTEYGGKKTDFGHQRTSESLQMTTRDWQVGLTSLRRIMLEESDVRIVLGGQVSGYKGVMPGIAEEALFSLRASQPLFLLGGFGGCARDIAETIGLLEPWSREKRTWEGRNSFKEFKGQNLDNGLSPEENRILASTPHIDEAIPLILRGMVRASKDDEAEQ